MKTKKLEKQTLTWLVFLCGFCGLYSDADRHLHQLANIVQANVISIH